MDKQASLLGVQNNKLSTVQDSDMLAENLEHSCSVVVENLVTSSTHDTLRKCDTAPTDVTRMNQEWFEKSNFDCFDTSNLIEK